MADEHQYETRAERREAETRRAGTHRTAASPGKNRAATAVVILLALVALLLVVGAVNIIRSAGVDPEAKVEKQKDLETGAPGGAEPTDDSSEATKDAESSKPTDEASKEPSDKESSDADADSGGVSTVKGESSDPKLSILNASGVNGAARKYANQYESQGWTLGRVGNAGTQVQTTVVYYSSSEYKDAAERVAKGLGVDTEQSSRYQVGVTVFMGPDVAGEDPAQG